MKASDVIAIGLIGLAILSGVRRRERVTTVRLERREEVRPKPPTPPPPSQATEIIELRYLPTTEKGSPLQVTVHALTDLDNIAIRIAFIQGPDQVDIAIDNTRQTLMPGDRIDVVKRGMFRKCNSAIFRGRIVFRTDGYYVFNVISGHYEGGEFVADQTMVMSINVRTPTTPPPHIVPIPRTPSIPTPTPPSPTPPRVIPPTPTPPSPVVIWTKPTPVPTELERRFEVL